MLNALIHAIRPTEKATLPQYKCWAFARSRCPPASAETPEARRL